MPRDEALPPPYQPDPADNSAADDAAQLPSYEDHPDPLSSTPRQTAPATPHAGRSVFAATNPFRSRAAAPPPSTAHAAAPDEKSRLIREHNQRPQPDQPPPGYFASSSTDCPHWVERRCRLTARPRQCCTCMDKRPETKDGRYPVYMDGYAELGSVVRWAHYCAPCCSAESRLHGCRSTRARPPPGLNWEDAQRKKMDQEEQKEQRRVRKEAAEQKSDDAWVADQLQRLSQGQPVAGITVRRHFLMTSAGTDEKGKARAVVETDKAEKKGKKEKQSIPRGCFDVVAPEVDPLLKPITAAEIRAARKMWERHGAVDKSESKRWADAKAEHDQKEAEAAREAERCRHEEQTAAERRAEQVYGDGARCQYKGKGKGKGKGRATDYETVDAGGGDRSSGVSRLLARLLGRRDKGR